MTTTEPDLDPDPDSRLVAALRLTAEADHKPELDLAAGPVTAEAQLLPARYRSLANFYTADPRRVSSREQDVGLWWRESSAGPLHRAAWVRDTGELYLVRLGPAEVGGGEVELLAVVDDHERLESVLAGWREQCGAPDSLRWLRARAARLSERVRIVHGRVSAAMGATAMIALAAGTVLDFA
jgi:hypothetical protein